MKLKLEKNKGRRYKQALDLLLYQSQKVRLQVFVHSVKLLENSETEERTQNIKKYTCW